VPRIDKCRARRRRLLPGFPSISTRKLHTAGVSAFSRRATRLFSGARRRRHVATSRYRNLHGKCERDSEELQVESAALSLSLSRRGDRRNLDEGRRKAKSQIRAPMDQVNQIARARNAWLADANGGVLGGLLLTYRIVRNERSRLPRGSRYAAMARKACIKDRSWALYWPIYMTVELITASQL